MYHVFIATRDYRDGEELLRDTYILVGHFDVWEEAADAAGNISNTLPKHVYVGLAGQLPNLRLQVTDIMPGCGYDFLNNPWTAKP